MSSIMSVYRNATDSEGLQTDYSKMQKRATEARSFKKLCGRASIDVRTHPHHSDFSWSFGRTQSRETLALNYYCLKQKRCWR